MKKGFTLIEIIVVMAVIAILFGVSATSYTASMKKARDSERKFEFKTIQTALEVYHQQNGAYPINPTGNWVCSTDAQPWIPQLTTEYIKELPRDPTNNGNANSNYAYCYYSHNNFCGMGGVDYILTTRLENTQDSSAGNRIIVHGSGGSSCEFWSPNGPPPVVDLGRFSVSSP